MDLILNHGESYNEIGGRVCSVFAITKESLIRLLNKIIRRTCVAYSVELNGNVPE